MATRKGEAARQRIVAAAWSAVDETGVEQILAGVTVREVARRADMSPSMVTYHFGTMADLADAMVTSLLDDLQLIPADAVSPMFEADGRSVGEVVRVAAAFNWQILTLPEVQAYTRRLMRVTAAAGTGKDGDRLAELLRARYWDVLLGELRKVYQVALDGLDLRLVEPFDTEMMARIGAAFEASLVQQWMLDPEGVPIGLSGDVLVALISSVTVPAARNVELAEIEAGIPIGSQPARPWAGEDSIEVDEQEVAHLRSIAVAAAPLFRSGVRSVTMTDVAHTVGVPVAQLARGFGTVQRIAAVSFVRHLDPIVEALHRRQDVSAELSAADMFCELARCAQADPFCARALMSERVTAQLLDQPFGMADIRFQVPVALAAVTAIQDLAPVTTAQAIDLGALTVDTTLSYAMTRRELAPAKVAAVVMRLIPRD
jgi:AcrR family transcriptional regulator